MNKKYINEIRKINYLSNETDSAYHRASLKLGISDSVSIILYTIYDIGDECLLSEIYKSTGISRQTINSAIRGLESDGILYLEPINGKSKKVVLTEKGREYVKQTAAKIFQAEIAAFENWEDEEISTYIRLMQKHVDCLAQEVEKI